jgi:hypothetical protein
MKQLEDIGKHSHRSHVRTGAGPLNHQWRLGVAFGIEGDDVVAAFRHGDGMIARKVPDTRACMTSRKRSYIAKYGIVRARSLQSSRLTHSRELAGNFAGSTAINARSVLCLQRSVQFFQQLLPPRPGFVARLLVALAHVGVSWLAGTHEAVTRTFVNHRLVFFAGGFH